LGSRDVIGHVTIRLPVVDLLWVVYSDHASIFKCWTHGCGDETKKERKEREKGKGKGRKGKGKVEGEKKEKGKIKGKVREKGR